MPKLTEIFGIRKEWVEGQPKGGAPRLVDVFEVRSLNENPSENSGFDLFPEGFGEFKADIDRLGAINFGKRWKQDIDGFQGWAGATDQVIYEMYRKFWTVYESIAELAVYHDAATNNEWGFGDPETEQHYPNFKIVRGEKRLYTKHDWDPNEQDVVERKERPNSPEWFKKFSGDGSIFRNEGLKEAPEGLFDDPDEFGDDDYGKMNPTNPDANDRWGWDHFPQTPLEFEKDVDQACRKNMGANWKQKFDQAQGWTGAADWAVDQMWEGNWTVYEATNELAVYWEWALGNHLTTYPHAKITQGQRTIPIHWNDTPSSEMFYDEDGEPRTDYDNFLGQSTYKDPVDQLNVRDENVVREADDDDDTGRDPFGDSGLSPGFRDVTVQLTHDKFPKSFPEYKALVERSAAHDLGADFKNVIDRANGFDGATDWAIQQFWDGFWTASEAHWELAFIYECAANNINDPKHYPRARIVQGKNTIGPKEDIEATGYVFDGSAPEEEQYRDHRPDSPQWFKSRSRELRRMYEEPPEPPEREYDDDYDRHNDE